MKKIAGFLLFIWGAFWFMLITSLLTIIYALILGIGGKKYSMQCVWINYSILSPLLLKLLFIKLKTYNLNVINPKRAYVIVANHTTAIDIIITASASPQPARFLAKSETKYIPIFGYMVRMLAIIVDRNSKESREKSYGYMAAALAKGESLMLYPEGTRNKTTEKLKEFKDGAFKVAIMAQAPIAIQTIVGAQKLNPTEGLQVYPGQVEVYWHVIETNGMKLEDIDTLKERVRYEMLRHL